MKKIICMMWVLFASLSAMASGYDVAAIIWPAYHPAPRWKELGIFEHGNGEWQNVYQAVSKAPGDNQPLVPLWGYESEADPIAVARKIDAALAAGVNVFMYDWYWYGNRPFLEDALNEGFLKAPNNERMKFFIMWANHDVDGLWNNKVGGPEKKNVAWSADVSYDEFTKVLVPRFIEYFKKPNYYKINGKPLFAIYLLRNIVRGMGDSQTAKKALDYFRDETKKAGFEGIHFVCMMNSVHDILSESDGKEADREKIAKYFDLDSMTLYNWSGIRDAENYADWREKNMAKWDEYKKAFGTFFPIISTGWDTNPRYPANEFKKIIAEKSPKEYEKSLRIVKNWADKNIPEGMPKLILINAWNEWTEGEYLEPDKKYGYEYLNATARVFGGSGQAKDE